MKSPQRRRFDLFALLLMLAPVPFLWIDAVGFLSFRAGALNHDNSFGFIFHIIALLAGALSLPCSAAEIRGAVADARNGEALNRVTIRIVQSAVATNAAASASAAAVSATAAQGSANSAAASALILANPDYGFFVDAPSSTRDYGSTW